MKLEVPLRKSTEVLPLIKAGAGMFYCGVLSDSKVNNRHNSILHQFADFRDLQIAIDIAHRYDKEIFLTLNSLKSDINTCLRQIDKAIKCGIDGIIIADMTLLEKISELGYKVKIYFSVLVSIYNSVTFNFLKNNYITGMCFERNVSLANMEAIIKENKALEYSAFVSGNCSNTQVLCKLHASAKDSPIYLNEGGEGELVCEGWYGNASAFLDNVGCKDWCSLCAIKQLKNIGVQNLKIEGRSLDLKARIRKTQMYYNCLQIVNVPNYIEQCKNIYRKNYGIDCRKACCYYW